MRSTGESFGLAYEVRKLSCARTLRPFWCFRSISIRIIVTHCVICSLVFDDEIDTTLRCSSALGFAISKKEAKEMIREVDRSGNGYAV